MTGAVSGSSGSRLAASSDGPPAAARRHGASIAAEPAAGLWLHLSHGDVGDIRRLQDRPSRQRQSSAIRPSSGGAEPVPLEVRVDLPVIESRPGIYFVS